MRIVIKFPASCFCYTLFNVRVIMQSNSYFRCENKIDDFPSEDSNEASDSQLLDCDI